MFGPFGYDRNGEYCGSGDGYRIGRTGSGFLDVGDCPGGDGYPIHPLKFGTEIPGGP